VDVVKGSQLTRKVAIVTGAAMGIGRSVAEAFSAHGAKVALWDINADAVAATAEELRASGGEARGTKVDVRDAAQVARAADAVAAEWGRIDILVNNAGGGGSVSGLDVAEQQWDDIVALNLKSQFLCCRAVAPYMERQRYGRIINMASNAGKYRSNTGIGGIPYGAAKAGVMQLTRHVAYAVGRHGITVNAIAPGSVLTEAGVREEQSLEPERRERILRETPLGRFARPEEIAAIAVFLASNDASYVTGATILASGGWCSS
jgi:NAD(P)-dependent dehydrogenase (short-subunit alcohol dehydrogenase family)